VTAVLLALRLGRWGIVGFSLAGFVFNFVNAVGFFQIAGHTPQERAALGATMSALAAQLVVLLPPPIRPDTVAGYVQFRGFNSLAILFAVWALASATGFARADEEKGLVESELATGTSRVALVGSRVLAFAIALAVAAALAGMAFVVGVASGNESFEPGRVVEAAANLVALGLACYAISLLVSQLTAARFATAAAGAALLALFFLNSLSRVFSWLSTWRWLSPFRYYDLSQPLPQGGQLDVRAFLVLLGIALVASSAAAFAFWRRDLGGALVRVPMRAGPPRYEPSTSPWWRYPVLRGLYERRLGLLAWSAGVAGLAVLFVSLTRTIVNVLLNIPALLPYLSIFVHQQLYPAVLGYTWLNVAQLLFAGLAITHVARWSAEDSDGRLEMALSAPYSRAAVVVERMAVLVAVALVVAAVSGLTLYYASHANGIDLNVPRLTAASLMLVPFALVFAGAGALLASWNPRATVGLLGAFAFASYLDTELGAVFKLPAWLQDLSAFKLFGTPLLTGVEWRSVTLMLLLAAAGVGSSILLMQRRDVGR
jgi:ABC-2 type transport system permease protein